MTQRMRTLPRWLIPGFLVTALLPAAVQAGHDFDRELLFPAVDQLHHDTQKFEQLACQRWFPRHELDYIRLMTKKACRLADGVKCDASFGRVRGDYHVLRGFIRTVDHRLSRHSASRFDRPLMQCWNTLKYDFEGIGCLIEGCRGQCGHTGPGHIVPAVTRPLPGYYDQSQCGPNECPPPRTPAYGGHNPGYRDRFSDHERRYPADRVFPAERSYHSRRSAHATNAWLEALMAALSR